MSYGILQERKKERNTKNGNFTRYQKLFSIEQSHDFKWKKFPFSSLFMFSLSGERERDKGEVEAG